MKKINFILDGILKPILKHYSPVSLIIKRNWISIIGKKYFEYCELEKINFKKNKKNDGTIYITCFNNVISFYIENNKFFILEKINAIFGYNLVRDIKLKQNPKIIQTNKQVCKINNNFSLKVNNLVHNVQDLDLKKSLKEFGESIYSK